MSDNESIISLRRDFFSEREQLFARHGELSARLFRYDTGVEAVQITNARGNLTMLPFQGQQIWDARFDGRTLTMKSFYGEPNLTREFVATYGAFVLHCGATAMGNPGPGDRHPLHGELPNAPYQSAYLALGTDQQGPYLALGGEYRHAIAFECNYVAQPRVTLRPGRAVFSVCMEIGNLRTVPMDLMYLAHINFRPVDHARLVYSAPCTPGTVTVRTIVPSDIHPAPGYPEFLRALAADPSVANVLEPGMAFDPEAVLYLRYRAGADGWARTLMLHPDKYASYVGHKPAQLPHGVRWISRMADQDAIGIVLPATAEPDGYQAEKAKGNVLSLPGRSSVHYDIEAGLLTPAESDAMVTEIQAILSRT